MNHKKIKAKKLRFKHLDKHITVGDKFYGLYGTLDEISMESGEGVEVSVPDNQYGNGMTRMTLHPNAYVYVESK